MKALKITILLVALLSVDSLLAATYHVPQDYATVQAAIDVAQDSDTIIIAPGRYVGSGNRNINLNGKKITVRSTNPSDPQVVNSTIIDCEGASNGFVFYTGESADSKVAGLTIANGYAFLGGAIYCYGSSPTITDCVIVGNRAGLGGGIACSGSASSPRITSCWIKANSAMVGGGGIYCNSGSPTVRNCILSGNYAPQGGAVYSQYAGNPLVANSSISANNAGLRAGGLYCAQASNMALSNTILWGNNAAYAAEALVGNSGATTSMQVFYCDVKDREQNVICDTGCSVDWGQGNTDVDPCFVQVGYPADSKTCDGGDYHLLTASACVDSGDPGFNPEPGETDIDGQPRVAGARIDMGADEREAAATAIAATVDVKPETLNLSSNAKHLLCAIKLGDGYNVADIDVSSVRLNGSGPPIWSVIDEDEKKLLVKFDRSQVEGTLAAGSSPVSLTVSGNLNDGSTCFEGTDTIRILSASGKGKGLSKT